MSAVTLLDGIYAIGGCNGKDYLNSAERFDERKREWVFIEEMKEKRSGMAGVVSQDL